MASPRNSRVSLLRDRPYLRLVIPTRRDEPENGEQHSKDAQPISATGLAALGTLTPDVQAIRGGSDAQSQSQPDQCSPLRQHVECVDNEFLVYRDPLTPSGTNAAALRAFDLHRRCMCVCKIYPLSQQHNLLNVYTAGLQATRLLSPRRVKVRDTHLYAFFDVTYGDLHGYIRERQRLSECEARHLFVQVVEALDQAHRHGLVLRDLKLRKLVFADPQRCELLLDGIADGVLLSDALDDQLAGPHQCCPAYLSPEVLDNARTGLTYSGRASDCWSLGVVLFTMATGRYPFWSTEPVALFQRISAAQYGLPEHCSPAVRSLIAGLLRREQAERLTVAQVRLHPWLAATSCVDHENAVECVRSRSSVCSSRTHETLLAPAARHRETVTAANATGVHSAAINSVTSDLAAGSESARLPARRTHPAAQSDWPAANSSASAAAATVIIASSLNRASAPHAALDAERTRGSAINATDSAALSNSHYHYGTPSNEDARTRDDASHGRNSTLQHSDVAFVATHAHHALDAHADESSPRTSTSTPTTPTAESDRVHSERHRHHHRLRAHHLRGPYLYAHFRRAKSSHCTRHACSEQLVPAAH